MENTSFQSQFINHFCFYLNTRFTPEYINNHISFCMISSEHFKKITEFIDYMDRRETDREFREILNEYFGSPFVSQPKRTLSFSDGIADSNVSVHD